MWTVLRLLGFSGVHRDAQASHSAKQYHGLRNQGSTCYLNTVLQCLYMTKDFRTAVQSFKQDPQDSNQGNAGLLLQLQNLFGELNKVNATTEGITESLSINNGELFSMFLVTCLLSVLFTLSYLFLVYEQQDAVEYYQRILKQIVPQVSQVFEGKLSNNSKCPDGHIYQEKCPFITIPLAIDTGHDKIYNVKEGLEAFFQPSQLDEDNWLYCDQCDQKTETETWNEIEEFPTVLTLHLKRFDFDYMQMRHVKNHCPMEIPPTLQLKDYEYDLYAVVNHSGDRNGGHYNAAIKSFEDNQWYCFDDSSVTKYSVDALQKSRLAYLLMYRQTPSRRNFTLQKLLKSTALRRMTSALHNRFIIAGVTAIRRMTSALHNRFIIAGVTALRRMTSALHNRFIIAGVTAIRRMTSALHNRFIIAGVVTTCLVTVMWRMFRLRFPKS
ncbi:ubiquitin carboxyl-terminal hydrolase 47 isoform X2 [Pygocentrus nattereri]|uniref:ubiquitin carboxyl-terminal hydrolase 47 isoform X2 n=1 Tax=Pygocentrus nattereri TaxID=42514 RepID=UPI00081464F2|nr:ubiquitin carboxyl-terminal hydrolase 47 isoform X2 [Pygocentrus nattereri]